jgi:hypothetical protein
MSKAKHTPGPWKAIEWSCHARTTVVKQMGDINLVVAECSGHGREASYSLADAALIAAAPELLEACEEAQKELLGVSSYLETCEPEIITQNLDSLVASLQAKLAIVEYAIRKAKGE